MGEWITAAHLLVNALVSGITVFVHRRRPVNKEPRSFYRPAPCLPVHSSRGRLILFLVVVEGWQGVPKPFAGRTSKTPAIQGDCEGDGPGKGRKVKSGHKLLVVWGGVSRITSTFSFWMFPS
ncbi:unnamed protein product [Boreogadus saida]